MLRTIAKTTYLADTSKVISGPCIGATHRARSERSGSRTLRKYSATNYSGPHHMDTAH